MNNRERILNILHYRPVDHVPVVFFGFWGETIQKWGQEGALPKDMADGYGQWGRPGGPTDKAVFDRIGIDFDWGAKFGYDTTLRPHFEEKVLRTEPDGSVVKQDGQGLIVRTKPGIVSIPSNVGTILTDRKVWESEYLPRLTYSPDRIDWKRLESLKRQADSFDVPFGTNTGSLYGKIRDMIGVEELSYMAVDDEDLYLEIIDTVGNLCYDCAKAVLDTGIKFDFAHFWEDICFKNGPLVNPKVFRKYVGPHYKRITDLFREHGTDIVTLDCDGCIDLLVPIWLENGVNTMFPMEVGTWGASIEPWRAKYGKELRGIGGMDKRVFAQDKAAVDRELDRLARLMDLGGYLPCPDHRVAPDAKYDLVRYYCDEFHRRF